MSTEAVRLVEQIQDALGTGDVVAALADTETEQAVRQVFSELAEPDFQVVMRGPAYLPGAFEGTGVDGFRERWSEWTSAFESYRIDVERVIDAGDLVVSLVTMAGKTRTGGVEIEAPGAAVWTVVDGRLRRVEFHLDRDEALRAAGIEAEPG
jgi:ketosteroid isomerase-like protein